MSTHAENIFSLRIVTVDHYLNEPLPDLDPCYSQFRGTQVAKVPVVRIFGTDSVGIKTCAHVHGVFPYLYIPFDDNFEDSSDQFTYQVASGLDKAINISLGQSHSDTEHVFKIVHVKGIPFYGFHPKEHQFLKIYLYNPLFVRRAANLFQNGAILGKVYQPHESHVPFGLQFLIDYNLYGMSFLHVPAETVCYRKSPNEIVANNDYRKFTNKAERTAVSKQEIDVGAAQILNRFEMDQPSKQMDHANPGIASIWKDEKVRRSRQPNEKFPTLEIPPPEDRPLTKPTESDAFFREALISKLSQINESQLLDLNATLDQTLLSRSGLNQTKNQFNLKQLLVNSVYPAECSQLSSGNMLDASLIINHQSGRITYTTQNQKVSQTLGYLSLNNTLVDEDIVNSLSQRASQRRGDIPWADVSLNEAELALLEIMQQLEENDKNECFVDNDSVLAPLSQQRVHIPSAESKLNQTLVNASQTEVHDEDFANSDDDLFNDFSMCFDSSQFNIEENSDNNTDAVKHLQIPQFDGAVDPLQTTNTPRKTTRASRYPELNVTVCQSPNKPNHLDQIIELLNEKREVSLEPIAKRPKRNQPPSQQKMQSSNKATTNFVDLTLSDDDEVQKDDASFMDCKLRPNRPSNVNGKDLLKTVSTTDLQFTINENHNGVSLQPLPNGNSSNTIDKVLPTPSLPTNQRQLCPKEIRIKLPKIIAEVNLPIELQVPESVEVVAKPTGRYGLRNRVPTQASVPEKKQKPIAVSKRNGRDLEKPETIEPSWEWSSSATARQFDILHNFFPEPGPSHVNYYEHMDMSVYYNPKSQPKVDPAPAELSSTTDKVVTKRNPNIGPKSRLKSCPKKANGPTVINTLMRPPTFDFVLDAMPNYGIPYCFDTSMNTNNAVQDIVEDFKSDVVPGKGWLAKRKGYETIIDKQTTKPAIVLGETILESLLRPPNFDEVLDAMCDFDIPFCIATEPFYGDSNDATVRKEISNSNILHIPTQILNDVGDFVSDVVENNGFVTTRNDLFKKIMGTEKLLSHSEIRCKLASTIVECILSPSVLSPSYADAERWIQSKSSDTYEVDLLADSPIKVPRISPTITVGDEDDDVVGMDVPLKMSQLTQNVEADENVIEASPTSKTMSSLPNGRARHRDVIRLQKPTSSKKIANALMECSESPEDRNGFNNSSDEVICVDDDDDVAVVPISDSSQLFLDRRRVNNAASDGNVLVTASTQSFTQSSGSFADHSFGISGATLDNTFGFKMNLENLQKAIAHSEYNYLTILSLEIHVRSRGSLRPDPQHDEIICIFYHIQNNSPSNDPSNIVADQPTLAANVTGVIINEHHDLRTGRIAHTVDAKLEVQHVSSEPELLLALVKLIGKWDPDIFAGYEIEMASWGYVLQRGQTLNINLPALMSRVPSHVIREVPPEHEEMSADWGGYIQFEVKLCGRIFLDVWRLMRSEIALTSYTFESVMFHIMHRRCPLHGWRDLTRMWGAEDAVHVKAASSSRWIVVEYYLERVRGNLELLNQLDLIGRTCELAKLFGIQFFEVLSRGSQFRVESMMLRIAKPKNIIPVSPSVQQRAHMRAPEYLPLILEPLSRLYSDSIIVLDFQSLYPSVIIAYNYCYSTCLGRVEHLGQSAPFEFGASQLRISPQMLRRLIKRDLITISPCGAVFVKNSVREGVLPRMLKEILDTRLMVKQSMKLHRNDPLLQRVLHSRQLGLKLMANVTYGYTAANFSGRMPCVEVGDSVVSKGRETLERAIKMVAANAQWRSRVIYGDTDSMFVLVPGRTREEAFKIGAEIADAVTQDNPYPIKLKLEKVYQPSILQTKKRYVGYMFETPDQAKPVYEAKGIETVRRDGCPAVAKMLEKTLKILFETKDVSKVKSYVCRQFTKILSGKMNVQDFIFAKEFRGSQGYKPGACVPSLELARRWRLQDPRSEPRRGERVPYLVVNGPPGVPLIKLVRGPHEVLADPGLKINSFYYITKVIVPPLNRCLLLIGADASHWFADLPRKHIVVPTTLPTVSLRRALLSDINTLAMASKKSTISQYFSTTSCPTDCGAQTQTGTLCVECLASPAHSVTMLSSKIGRLERQRMQLQRVCSSCCSRPIRDDILCRSLDCPVLYVVNNCGRQFEEVSFLRTVLSDHFL